MPPAPAGERRGPRTRQVALLLLLAAATGRAFTVATYNVENYTQADRMADGVHRAAYPKPESERTALRQVLRSLDADVLALQEMGGLPYLQELQRDLRREGLDYPYAELLAAADPDRHVAVLAKRPLRAVRHHAAVPCRVQGRTETVKRGVLEVTVAAPGGEITIFVVHLKSQRTEQPGDPQGAARRLGEARAVRDLVLARFPEPERARFLLCGDWNDRRDSPAYRALTRRGRVTLGTVLPAADSRGEGWTHYYRREHAYTCLDYILVSAAVLPQVAGGRAEIPDGPATRRASDHRPVVLHLTAPSAAGGGEERGGAGKIEIGRGPERGQSIRDADLFHGHRRHGDGAGGPVGAGRGA